MCKVQFVVLFMINSVTTSSYSAMGKSLDDLQKAAQDITHDRDLKDIERNSVKLIQSVHETQANAKVVKTADQMMGTLIDIKI